VATGQLLTWQLRQRSYQIEQTRRDVQQRSTLDCTDCRIVRRETLGYAVREWPPRHILQQPGHGSMTLPKVTWWHGMHPGGPCLAHSCSGSPGSTCRRRLPFWLPGWLQPGNLLTYAAGSGPLHTSHSAYQHQRHVVCVSTTTCSISCQCLFGYFTNQRPNVIPGCSRMSHRSRHGGCTCMCASEPRPTMRVATVTARHRSAHYHSLPGGRCAMSRPCSSRHGLCRCCLSAATPHAGPSTARLCPAALRTQHCMD